MITDLGKSCSQRRHKLEEHTTPIPLSSCRHNYKFLSSENCIYSSQTNPCASPCRGLWLLVWSTMDLTDSHTSEMPLQEPGLADSGLTDTNLAPKNKQETLQRALSLLAGGVPWEWSQHPPLWGCSCWFQDSWFWIRHGVFYPNLTSHRCSRARDKACDWFLTFLFCLDTFPPSPHPYFSLNPGQQGGRESSVHLFITNIDKQHVKALLTWKVLAYLTKNPLDFPWKAKTVRGHY